MGTSLSQLKGHTYDSMDIVRVYMERKDDKRKIPEATALPFEAPRQVNSVYFHRRRNWERVKLACGQFPCLSVSLGDPGMSVKVYGKQGGLEVRPSSHNHGLGQLVGRFRVISVAYENWTDEKGRRRNRRYQAATIKLKEPKGDGCVIVELRVDQSEQVEVSPGGRFFNVERGGLQTIAPADVGPM
ncbi:hypothetical protein AB1Y20_019824 [Prymnesium parvum]|uniref:Uncharacterized protein n=1 Tax=Prymnesium parvum TaxID=97485 RepID=A0AB34JVK4_PRYPA